MKLLEILTSRLTASQFFKQSKCIEPTLPAHLHDFISGLLGEADFCQQKRHFN